MNYTYIIIHKFTGMMYIGKRKSLKKNLQEDLEKYQSSSTDLSFKEEMKLYPERFIFKITAVYTSDFLCALSEITQHKFYGVGENPDYYNKSEQTSLRFDTTGQPPWNKGLTGDELTNYVSKNYKTPDESAQYGEYNGMYGKKHTEFSKQLMKDKLKGRKSHRMKSVKEYDVDMNLVKVFPSAEAARKHYDFGKGVVDNSCRNKHLVFGISYFRY